MMLTSCMDMFFRGSENTESNTSQTSDSSGSTTTSSSGGGSSGSDTIYPTSLTISGATSLFVGEEVTLTATYQPSNVTYKTINWRTSNSSIASATSAGKVKGKAAGDVTISAEMTGPNGTKVTATHDMVVSIPSPASVSLNKTSVTLSFGKTVQLSATVNPAAANQAVTWSSDNQSVATVNSSGLVTAKSVVGNANITATTVEGNKTASCAISVQEVSGTTIMIYMCGADLESGDPEQGSGYLSSGYQGLASMDIDEILSVNGQPENVNIVLETGGAARWAKNNINPNYLERWEIRDKVMSRKSQLSRVSMGKTSTLQSFIEWGLENYPAEKYGLILWNHGGAMAGCCYDENASNDTILADELYDAVSGARSNKGITDKFEWITYDACLMAVQDVAEYNSHNFKYMLSSQETEMGYGYAYADWLPSLYSNPEIDGGQLLTVIGETFMDEEEALFKQWYGSRWTQEFDQTQSVYDLTKMAAYKTAFEDLASSLNSIVGSNSTKIDTLGSLFDSSKAYGLQEDHGTILHPYDIFDVEDALTNVKNDSTFSSVSSKVQAVLSALGDVVIYEEHGPANSGCGMCIYCPMSWYSCSLPYDLDYTYQGTRYVGPHSNFTNWKVVANKIANAA